MLCTPYQPGNQFSRYCSVADAAIEWQGLTADQLELVLVDETGIPFLAGCPDLTNRANAIVEAVQEREIGGHTHTEDGYPRRPDKMMLSRDSVNAWMAKVTARVANPPPEVPLQQTQATPELLTTKEVEKRTGLSRSKIHRDIKTEDFPAPTHPSKGGNRWSVQVIEEFINGGKKPAGEDV